MNIYYKIVHIIVIVLIAIVSMVAMFKNTIPDDLIITPSTRHLFNALYAVDVIMSACILLSIAGYILLFVKSSILIYIYFIILLMSLICTIISSMSKGLHSMYVTDILTSIAKREALKNTDAEVDEWLAHIQKRLNCCGSKDYDDYVMPPPSCCNTNHENVKLCLGKRAEKPVNIEVSYYERGCLDIMVFPLNEWNQVLYIVCIVHTIICIILLSLWAISRCKDKSVLQSTHDTNNDIRFIELQPIHTTNV